RPHSSPLSLPDALPISAVRLDRGRSDGRCRLRRVSLAYLRHLFRLAPAESRVRLGAILACAVNHGGWQLRGSKQALPRLPNLIRSEEHTSELQSPDHLV